MTIRRKNDAYSLGDDVDFDQFNEQTIKNLTTVESVEKLPNVRKLIKRLFY